MRDRRPLRVAPARDDLIRFTAIGRLVPTGNLLTGVVRNPRNHTVLRHAARQAPLPDPTRTPGFRETRPPSGPEFPYARPAVGVRVKVLCDSADTRYSPTKQVLRPATSQPFKVTGGICRQIIRLRSSVLRFIVFAVTVDRPRGGAGSRRLRDFRSAAMISMNKTLVIATGLIALTAIATSAHAQSLRGSAASVNRIHSQALAHSLRFYASASSIREAASSGTLRRLEPNADFRMVDVSYPYLVPATHTFVVRLASQYRSACGEQMVVTSATRPTTMRLINSSDKSVHPTGMAVDLRKPTNSRCLSWLRNTLGALEAAGVLDAVEERNPPHFHVAVFPRQYAQYVENRGGSSVTLATAASAPSVSTKPRPAPASSSTSYVVRSGDSLWTIARKNNISVDALKRANSLSSNRILAGQRLKIPG